jgi:hypothetical protein
MGRKLMADAGLTGLIRLVKRWIKLQEWPEGEYPNSYCMELVLAAAYKGKSSKRVREPGEHTFLETERVASFGAPGSW